MKNRIVRITVLGVFTFFVLWSAGCSEKRRKVQHVAVKNFSDISYAEAPSSPYFDNIEYLPYKITLNDPTDHDSIYYLTESTNLLPMEDEHLAKFLTEEELQSAYERYEDPQDHVMRRKIAYYSYGRIVTEHYILLEINRRNNVSYGRDYTFSLRTYDFSGKLISQLPYARVCHEEEIYYSGTLQPDMTIDIVHHDGVQEAYIIQKDGRIERHER